MKSSSKKFRFFEGPQDIFHTVNGGLTRLEILRNSTDCGKFPLKIRVAFLC